MLWKKGRRSDNVEDVRDQSTGGGGGMRIGGGKGLSPEFGSSLLLAQVIGPVRAAQLLLLGDGFSGEQAAEWGLQCEIGRAHV